MIRVIPAWNQLNHVLYFWAALEVIFSAKRPTIRMISCFLWSRFIQTQSIYCQVGRYGSMDIAIVVFII